LSTQFCSCTPNYGYQKHHQIYSTGKFAQQKLKV
jgi:hypothetical protein